MHKIYNCYTSLDKYGGAELIALSLTNKLFFENYNSELLLLNNNHNVNTQYKLNDITISYITILKVSSFTNDDIILSHHRKCTTILILLKICLFKKFKIIHIAHNEFFNLRFLSIFPTHIVAVSNRVKENLINYFKVDSKKVNVIYNGIDDVAFEYEIQKSNEIKILYPARITNVKQQIEIVEQLCNKIMPHITIYFAGEGENVDDLCSLLKDYSQFKYIGYINIHEHISNFDYVMLFSKVEGLPTVLLEACMYSKPIICNNVGGNIEILENGKNGFLANDFMALIQIINNLPNNTTFEYRSMAKYARKVYENKFTISKMIDNYTKYLYDV